MQWLRNTSLKISEIKIISTSLKFPTVKSCICVGRSGGRGGGGGSYVLR